MTGIPIPLGSPAEHRRLIGMLNEEFLRLEPVIIGWRDDGVSFFLRFRSAFQTPWVQIHVQGTGVNQGGATYNPAQFVTSTERDCRLDRMQDVTVTIAGAMWIFLVPVQYDGAGVKILYDGQGGRPNKMAFIAISTVRSGAMGPPGPEGMEGPEGPVGAPGPAGGAGAAGAPGVAGSPGTMGPPGVDGIDGEPSFEMGPPGLPGAAGAAGSPGAAGSSGVAGPPGVDGIDGESSYEMGPPGPVGSAGPAGSPGSAGSVGPMGSPGYDGTDGEPSFEPGPPGPPGNAGAAGGAGAPGAPGPMGVPGPEGIEGMEGRDGAPGPSGPLAASIITTGTFQGVYTFAQDVTFQGIISRFSGGVEGFRSYTNAGTDAVVVGDPAGSGINIQYQRAGEIATIGTNSATSPFITFLSRLVSLASIAARAGWNLPHGTAPVAPVDGDVWTTTAGIFARINGVTVGPFGAAGGGTLLTGVASLDFGAFPGSSHASIAVAVPSVAAGSEIQAWLHPVATADHSEDEHMLETLEVFARDKNPGVGFTIHGVNPSDFFDRGGAEPIGTRLYGVWNVGWLVN